MKIEIDLSKWKKHSNLALRLFPIIPLTVCFIVDWQTTLLFVTACLLAASMIAWSDWDFYRSLGDQK